MRAKMLQLVMNAAFDLAMRKVIAAFEERAHAVLGARQIGYRAPDRCRLPRLIS